MDFKENKTGVTIATSLAGLTVALFLVGFVVKFYSNTPRLLNDASRILSLGMVFLVVTVVFSFYWVCCRRRCKVEK